MKKIFTLLVVLVISTFVVFSAKKVTIKLNSSSVNELNIISSTATNLTLQSSIASITTSEIITDEGIFNELYVENFGKNFNNLGLPHLPVLTRLCEIPYGATAKVKIISFDEEIIDLNSAGIISKINPAQPSISKSSDPDDIIYQYNKDAYLINEFIKDDIAWVDFKGTMRGVGIGRISISPFHYNPVSNQLKVYNNLVIEIEFENANLKATNDLKEKYYSPMFEANYSQLINYKPLATKDAVTTYPITYIIVSDPMFQADLQPFVQWKTRQGYKVIEGYTDVIGTTTTAIKAYLQNLYQTETPTPTFVLLVGDVAQIPTYNGTVNTHPTDLYYFTYDGAGDVIPEMFYGRWSVDNSTQLQVILEKTFMHEQYTWPDDSFLDKCVMIAGVDGTYAAKHGDGQIYYGIDQYFNTTNGYSDIYAYLYAATTHPYQVMTSTSSGAAADIRSKISAGVGFANYTAHCGPSGWSDPSFEISHIPALNNTDKYGLLIGNCCLSNKFNDNDCFGEEILYASKKGAVAYIGGSNSTYWDEDFYFGVGVNSLPITAANAQLHTYANTGRGGYDGIWHNHGEQEADWYITASELLFYGNLAIENSSSSNNVYYWEIYHLMGDPSLMVYLSIPDPLTVSYIDPITLGITSLTVNTEQYAYVAISQNNVLLDAQYSGTNTSVTLSFPPFTAPGQADIVVTKQNRQPYIGTLDIMSGNTNNDAGVTNVGNPINNYDCPQDVQPQFTIMNMGAINLTSLTVGYSLDGGAPVTQVWNGNLAQYSTQIITFPTISLSQGNHTFEAFSNNPNGTTDEYTANDTLDIAFVVNNNITVADFVGDELIFCTPPVTVNFTNNSSFASSYLWDFGDGNTSTSEDPSNTFNALGDYTISLIAYNGVCGSDTSIMTNYVSIDPGNPCEYIMPTGGTVNEAACAGTLFDSGGETGDYSDNENGIYVISPAGATDITLTFISFDVEENTWSGGCYDELRIYDGPSTSSTLIGTYCNENPPTVVSSTGGAITLNFISDYSVTMGGFEIDWTCNTTVNTEDITSNNGISIYPNPVKNYLNVNLNNTIAYKYQVVDVVGKIIVNENITKDNFQIDMTRLSDGVYYLNIIDGITVFSQKIVVVR